MNKRTNVQTNKLSLYQPKASKDKTNAKIKRKCQIGTCKNKPIKKIPLRSIFIYVCKQHYETENSNKEEKTK